MGVCLSLRKREALRTTKYGRGGDEVLDIKEQTPSVKKRG